MRILLLASAFNSLTQRVFVELDDLEHDVGASVVTDGGTMRQALAAFDPDIVVAPYLKTAIPEDVWRSRPCLVIHPGIRGDRGPSSLDWAILRGRSEWGVTVLQAAADFDAGDIWASRTFAMRPAAKSAIYRHEVADAAVAALLEAVGRVNDGAWAPEPLDEGRPGIDGRLERPMRQADRAIDWQAPTEEVLRRLRCADSTPGVRDSLFGETYHLFGGSEERRLRGRAGHVLGFRDGAICRATGDGAVWISHLKRTSDGGERLVKLPATLALAGRLVGLPDLGLRSDAVLDGDSYREIRYEERNRVGYLHFDFYNGAMSTEQCRALAGAYRQACRRPTDVVVLMGGADLWSNGIHLNVIEAADDRPTGAGGKAEPAGSGGREESWQNINAMDDLVRDIVQTESHIVVSAVAGNAGAGGVPLALAADRVWVRKGVVLNPHYKGMGLFGSEYWTYLLPRRTGEHEATLLADTCLPVGARRAREIGLVDDVIPGDLAAFRARVARSAEALAASPELGEMLRRKRLARATDEQVRPLSAYRADELAQMRLDFAGVAYQQARRAFVHKAPLEPFTHRAAVGPVIRPHPWGSPSYAASA